MKSQIEHSSSKLPWNGTEMLRWIELNKYQRELRALL